ELRSRVQGPASTHESMSTERMLSSYSTRAAETRCSERLDEHLAPAARFSARRTDDALLLHPLDELGRLVVSDAELPLDVADRAVSGLGDTCDRAVVERIVAAAAFHLAPGFVLPRLEDLLVVDRPALLAQVVAESLDLVLADVGAVHAVQVAGARRDHQHVAHAEQVLGALAAEDRLAVLALAHLETDAGGEVRLDHAGDDVDTRPLRRQDHVDAR